MVMAVLERIRTFDGLKALSRRALSQLRREGIDGLTGCPSQQEGAAIARATGASPAVVLVDEPTPSVLREIRESTRHHAALEPRTRRDLHVLHPRCTSRGPRTAYCAFSG